MISQNESLDLWTMLENCKLIPVVQLELSRAGEGKK